MNVCRKANCKQPSIGKYCIDHKPRSRVEEQYATDRLLREEQEMEFREAEFRDIEQMELKKILELSCQNYYEDLKHLVEKDTVIDIDNCLNIKIQLPNGGKIIKKFNTSSTVKNIKNFIELYIHENNIDIKNYILSLNFPKIQLESSFDEQEIQSISKSANFVLYLQDLDR
jgi:hypothetical protein